MSYMVEDKWVSIPGNYALDMALTNEDEMVTKNLRLMVVRIAAYHGVAGWQREHSSNL